MHAAIRAQAALGCPCGVAISVILVGRSLLNSASLCIAVKNEWVRLCMQCQALKPASATNPSRQTLQKSKRAPQRRPLLTRLIRQQAQFHLHILISQKLQADFDAKALADNINQEYEEAE